MSTNHAIVDSEPPATGTADQTQSTDCTLSGLFSVVPLSARRSWPPYASGIPGESELIVLLVIVILVFALVYLFIVQKNGSTVPTAAPTVRPHQASAQAGGVGGGTAEIGGGEAYCTRCGESLPGNAEWCPKCGIDQSRVTTTSHPQEDDR